jgi:hypothetical protein
MRRDLPPNPVSGIHVGSIGPTTQFLNARVRRLYDWWQACAGKYPQQGLPHQGLPLWQDFDIAEHVALAPYLFVVETPADGAYRFRLLGEAVIGMIGRNVVGELVQSRPSNDYGHDLYDYYAEIVRERECRMCRGTLDFVGSDHRHFEAIDCPTIDEAGVVTRIIGIMDYIG